MDSSSTLNLEASSGMPLYDHFNLGGDAANLLEGNAADLFWLWPQDVNADFLNNPGNDPSQWNDFIRHDV